MTTKLITCLLAAATITNLTHAQEKKELPNRERHRQNRKQMMLRRYDTNKDGKLDEAEKAEMNKSRTEFIKKYDADGDGKLSQEERKAAVEERKKKRIRRPKQEKRAELIKKYDVDGDGKLSQEERKKMREQRKAAAKAKAKNKVER